MAAFPSRISLAQLADCSVVLFDIDGTLLRQGNRVHGRSIIQAGQEITGHNLVEHFSGVDAGGRTDRYIVNELLRRCGLTPEQITESFDRIAHRSVELTGAGLSEPDPAWALEGGATLLAELASRGTRSGLVTGNLPKIAEIKLRCAGLWEPFEQQAPLIAAYGDLSEDRNELARAAWVQAMEVESDLDPTLVAVIGDTPRDIECAQAIGALSIGVTTGRYRREHLLDAGAHHVVDSLEDLLA